MCIIQRHMISFVVYNVLEFCYSIIYVLEINFEQKSSMTSVYIMNNMNIKTFNYVRISTYIKIKTNIKIMNIYCYKIKN